MKFRATTGCRDLRIPRIPGIPSILAALVLAFAGLQPLSVGSAETAPQVLAEPPRLDAHDATVLIFLQPDCPISNQYAPAIQSLTHSFASKDVAFCLVYPDGGLDTHVVREHLETYRLSGPACLDPELRLVKRSGATVTPEAAVFDREGRRVYRGRIDNRYVAFGKKRPAPTRHDLRLAIEAVLEGRSIDPPTTPAVGCYIDLGD